MITLYIYPRAMGLPNASPFCMKLETWLLLAGLEYEVRFMPNPSKTPLGKLPMIAHDGKKIADSGSIIPYLEEACGVDLDAGLNPQQKATSHAFMRMIEEHSYWGLVYGRWVDDTVWPQVRETWFGKMPPGIKQILSTLIRKQAVRDAHGQGLCRHPKAEVKRRIEQDLQALSTQLGGKDYLLDAEPHNIDATAYAFLANYLSADIDWEYGALVSAYPNLVAYCERMKARVSNHGE